MSGSKLASMTLGEMRPARARGESQTDWTRVRAAILQGEEPAEDEDSPSASADMRAHLVKLKRKRGSQRISTVAMAAYRGVRVVG